MGKFIRYQPPVQLMVQFNESIKKVKNNMEPYAIDLSESQKRGRSMAGGREGIVRLISKIALAHEESLGRKDNPEELETCLDYDGILEDLRQSAMALLEVVTETQLANSMDAMEMSDRYLGNLQNDRNNNSALDLALGEIDEWNKRFGARAGKGKAARNI
jgi:hypothetical protein